MSIFACADAHKKYRRRKNNAVSGEDFRKHDREIILDGAFARCVTRPARRAGRDIEFAKAQVFGLGAGRAGAG